MSRRAWVVAGVLAAQVLVVVAIRAVEARRGDAAAPGAPRYERIDPPRAAADLDVERAGARSTLSSLREGPTLVHFWATWCAPCRTELPALLAFGREGPAEVVAVSVDESWAVIEHHFEGSIPDEVVRADADAARRAFGASTLPLTVLVDEAGRVRGRFQGAQPWGEPARALVLREASSPSGGARP